MTEFNVIVTDGAEADFFIVLDWISQRSPQGAEKLFRRWQEMLVSIKAHADSYGLAPEDERHQMEIRQAIFKNVEDSRIARYSSFESAMFMSFMSGDLVKIFWTLM